MELGVVWMEMLYIFGDREEKGVGRDVLYSADVRWVPRLVVISRV